MKVETMRLIEILRAPGNYPADVLVAAMAELRKVARGVSDNASLRVA